MHYLTKVHQVSNDFLQISKRDSTLKFDFYLLHCNKFQWYDTTQKQQ